ncbi:sigma 54-interacting transcriptional regulator [Vagococcus sp. BWB3-3]|uniref:Sigma 54-interacting transcriptional regulator n=1 Tax=Vagococcus allomyrinae TaxID=2794353 RepID=A0A940PAG9_9ENTE|nr:sigma-54-dependent transcriptional regulator [Vagococcus allomyrinae]MBP1041140.1 sigma 54-interacting transcriptional regulator [Vagococcus allomyrinae]
MKRIEKIVQYLTDFWGNKSTEDIQKELGSNAKEVAKALGIARSNVSAELNKLVRAERVVKVKSYPVKYIPLDVLLAHHLIENGEIGFEIDDLANLDAQSSPQKNEVKLKKESEKIDPFEKVIGHHESLKKAISQAKAAIYYPPDGLHMLLLGPTGSGKTFFANKVFQYGKYAGIIEPNAPFITFNCADYYHNPQLLMSQLFGYIAGAFTGATADKVGLFEQADGGILLLDEVHRLPPEGQEMLFYFLDNKTFSRLGESEKKRTANVLIIFATTENPSSVLLGTFSRRIPMTIEIPALSKRSVSERIELMKYLFRVEAKRIEKILMIDIDVINVLLSAATYGNVGQLKSQIQLVCAQAFVNNLNSKERMAIHIQDLPSELSQDWLSSRSSLIGTKNLSSYLDVTTTIFPTNSEEENPEESMELNIYESIEKKASVLAEEGISQEAIYQHILQDLHFHIQNVVEKNSPKYSLQKFVNPKVNKIVEVLKVAAEGHLQRKFDRRFNYYVGMHLDAYLQRGEKTTITFSASHQEVIDSNKEEYEAAQIICKLLKEQYTIQLPEIEVIYYTMLLASLISLEETKKVAVLVVTHGNSTATSMVEVATELLGNTSIEAIDMPLTVSPTEIVTILCEKVIDIDNGEGVLLLVDMGSLAMMDKEIRKRTGVKVLSISNVTTSVVLDVARKINYTSFDLHSIYTSVKKDFITAFQLHEEYGQKKQAVLSICMSGEGTAKKMAQLIHHIVAKCSNELIEVITVSALDLKTKVSKITDQYSVIASVGTRDPQIGRPFISLDELIEGEGEQLLSSLISGETREADQKNGGSVLIRELCEETLRTYLVYLNPLHITTLLLEWIEALEEAVTSKFTNPSILKMVVHTAFAFERIIKKNPLKYTEEEAKELTAYLEKIESTLKIVETKIDLYLSLDEKKFIAEILREIS